MDGYHLVVSWKKISKEPVKPLILTLHKKLISITHQEANLDPNLDVSHEADPDYPDANPKYFPDVTPGSPDADPALSPDPNSSPDVNSYYQTHFPTVTPCQILRGWEKMITAI